MFTLKQIDFTNRSVKNHFKVIKNILINNINLEIFCLKFNETNLWGAKKNYFTVEMGDRLHFRQFCIMSYFYENILSLLLFAGKKLLYEEVFLKIHFYNGNNFKYSKLDESVIRKINSLELYPKVNINDPVLNLFTSCSDLILKGSGNVHNLNCFTKIQKLTFYNKNICQLEELMVNLDKKELISFIGYGYSKDLSRLDFSKFSNLFICELEFKKEKVSIKQENFDDSF
jgi:hypothetical protein